MEIDEEYIDKVKSLIEQKDAENVKTLLTDLHPADIAELCNDLGLEEARLKLGKCYDFPPTRLEQRQFTYSEDVAAAHGALPGSYTVTIDWRYAQAGEAYQVILVSSTGRLGPRHQVLAQRTLYAELDGAPTRSGPALNPKLFHWIEFRDEGSL